MRRSRGIRRENMILSNQYDGADDKLIPPGMMDRLYDSCMSKKQKFVIEGAGHGDSMTTDSETYWKNIFGFLSAI